MSYHILHIFDYGCRIFKDRGLLICQNGDTVIGKIAIEDLRAIVLANESVSISGNIISALCANDTAIVHCKKFKPIAVTMPLSRTYDARVVLNQAAGNKNLNSAIWRRMLIAKISNSVKCLNLLGIENTRLEFLANASELNEGLCAREYWKHYFPKLGEYSVGRTPDTEDFGANAMLNYGYGVMSAIVYRSIIVAGLNHLLGVNHKTYYKNTPLVFDVVEPFRAFVDYALYKYKLGEKSPDMRKWAIFFGKFLRDHRISKGGFSVKLMDAPDFVCESLANVYRLKKADNLWLPELTS